MKTKLKQFKYELLKNKIALLSIIYLLVIILLSICAPLLPTDPNKIDMVNTLVTPSLKHWFGTDELGRDYFTRAVYGGRVSLTVGFFSMLVSVILGTAVGTISGYYGGHIDQILMRIVDIIYSIPWLIMVTVISLFLKPGIVTMILIIGLISWTRVARLVRAETLTLKEREYVLYARSIGQMDFKLILFHIVLPALPIIVVTSSISIASAIMTESTLSFLNMGVKQPNSSWGTMLQNAQNSLSVAPYMSIFPGILIVLTVFSLSKVGDVLRVLIEPRQNVE